MKSEKWSQKQKVKFCLILNIVLLTTIGALIFLYDSNSKYFRFGPHEDLVMISVKINTWKKYCILLALVTITNIVKVLVEDIATPILTFTIYNPSNNVIRGDFTRSELRILSSSSFLVNNLRYIFEIMLTVTQLDIAIYSVFIDQLTGVYTINQLLKPKIFPKEDDHLIEFV